MSRPAKNASNAPARVPAVPAARRVRVRELRAHFKSLLAEGAPLLVGSRYNVKAIVLPALRSWSFSEQDREIMCHRLRALLEESLKQL